MQRQNNDPNKIGNNNLGFAGVSGKQPLKTGPMKEIYPSIEKMRSLAKRANQIEDKAGTSNYEMFEIRGMVKEILFAVASVVDNQNMNYAQKKEWLEAAGDARWAVDVLCKKAGNLNYSNEIAFLLDSNSENFALAKKAVDRMVN